MQSVSFASKNEREKWAKIMHENITNLKRLATLVIMKPIPDLRSPITHCIALPLHL